MGLPSPDHEPQVVRDLADRILADPRYDTPSEPIADRVIGWVGDQIARAFGALVSGGGGTVLAWVVLVGAVGSVVYLLVRHGRVRLPTLAGADEPMVMVEMTRTAEEWRTAAAQHEAESRWAEGLRCRHRALVAELVRRGVIPEQPGRTAGEHLRDVAAGLPEAAPAMAAATELFEAAWYGAARTGPDEAARFVALEGQVLGVRVG